MIVELITFSLTATLAFAGYFRSHTTTCPEGELGVFDGKGTSCLAWVENCLHMYDFREGPGCFDCLPGYYVSFDRQSCIPTTELIEGCARPRFTDSDGDGVEDTPDFTHCDQCLTRYGGRSDVARCNACNADRCNFCFNSGDDYCIECIDGSDTFAIASETCTHVA